MLPGGLTLKVFKGENLQRLAKSELAAIAHCYAEVFNQSWGEDWTEESALVEIQKSFFIDPEREPEREPIAVLLYRGSDVVGFSWANFVQVEHINPERDMPFKLSFEEKVKGSQSSKQWLTGIQRVKRACMIRELGVLMEFRGALAAHLILPIARIAAETGHNGIIYWTSTESRAFHLGVGVGWTPFTLFHDSTLVIMGGRADSASSIMVKGIQSGREPEFIPEFNENIRRFFVH